MTKCLPLLIAPLLILVAALTALAGPLTQAKITLPDYVAVPEKIAELDAAAVEFQRGQVDACLRQLQAAVKKHRNLPPARLMLARLYFANNQGAEGRRVLEQVAINYPGHPEVYLLFAHLALVENRLTDAQLHLEKAASLPAPPSWPAAQKDKLSIEFHAGRATIAERRRNWEAAGQALAAWLERDPQQGRVRERYARALFLAGQPREAYEQLTAAFAVDSTIEPPEVSMGAFFVQQEDHEQAEKWLRRALQSHPKDPRPHVEYAAYLMLHGRAEEVKTHLARASELNSTNLTKIRLLTGMAARQSGEFDKAQAAFEAILRESPGHFDAANQLALTLIESDAPSRQLKARQLAEMNVRQYPRLPAALATLGWVYYRSQRTADAERMLRAAASRGQIPLDATYFLARVLTDHGQQDEAQRALDLLKIAAAKPGLFVARAEAKRWLAQQ